MTSAEGLNDAQTDRSVAALHRAIDNIVVGGLMVVAAIEKEYTTATTAMYTESTATSLVTQPRSVILALREAHKLKAQTGARTLHQTTFRAAYARREVARKMNLCAVTNGVRKEVK